MTHKGDLLLKLKYVVIYVFKKCMYCIKSQQYFHQLLYDTDALTSDELSVRFATILQEMLYNII